MCIIIDTNRMDEFLEKTDHADIKPIYDWLEVQGRIVYSTGDKFATELTRKARKHLRTYLQSGKSRHISAARVADEANRLRKLRKRGIKFKSKDQHVLALAILADVRLLYTFDGGLHADFKNFEIIPFPKGQIYQGKQHVHLLQQTVCRQPEPRK